MPVSREITFFGYDLEDYKKMFNLDESFLSGMNILDCGGAGNSFALEMAKYGSNFVSIDPLYNLSSTDITKHFAEASQRLQAIATNKPNSIICDELPKELAKRQQVVDDFVNDFEQGLIEKRYQSFSLPSLPFRNEAFDLVLCSHFLFTHSHRISEKDHLEVIKELARIGDEVRIFPLIDENNNISPHLVGILQDLQEGDLDTEIQEVHYEFQQGGNAALIIDRKSCHIDLHKQVIS